jgi:putative phosphoribosyl transferase
VRLCRRCGGADPHAIVLAVPVASADTLQALRASVDDVVCLSEPEFFGGVGGHYRSWR